jgi:lipopolysaccharide/colanic/teichoic acid biosynthesis glycosyltransferase
MVSNLSEDLVSTVGEAPRSAVAVQDVAQASHATLTFIVPAEPHVESIGYRLIKRVLDVSVALATLIILTPLLIAVGLFIYFEDRGPILYRQWRVGRYGTLIPFYKFRSMWVDADKMRDALLARSDSKGIAFKMKNDPRITKVGRFIRKYSIDELPQLFCVLSGYMSIVGPRPLGLPEGYECAGSHRKRYLVKPGLVCSREVGGRSLLSFDEWMDLDEAYVDNRGLWTDFKIFVRVIPAVIRARGAY